QEPLGVFRLFGLYLPYLHQVFHPFMQRLHMSEHHGGRSSDPLVMRFMHYVEPFLRAAFSLADEPADPVHEDLRSGARQRVHTGCSQRRDDRMMAHFFQPADMGYFGWPEGV